MENILSYQDLFLEIPTAVIRLNRLEITERANEHGQALLEFLAEDTEEYLMIHNLTHTTDVKVAAMIGGELQVVFTGVMVQIELKKSENVFCVRLTLKSKSFLLDIEKKRRSFQHDTGMINDIFNRIIETDHDGQATSFELSGMEQGEALIQYDETDWQFVRRIASKQQKMLITNVKTHLPVIFIGTQIGSEYHEFSKGYTLTRESGDFLASALNFGDWTTEQKIFFEVKSVDNYEISDNILFENILFKVLQKKTILENEIVVFEYALVKEEGFKTDIFYNPNIVGASIKGKVLDIQFDRVKLHLEIDTVQDVEQAHFYKVQTPYTADGSTGFYVMPQVGDEMVLYFPENTLEEGTARSVSRQDGQSNIKTQDPNTKYFGNIHKKELMFQPQQWQATATNGFILINMDEGAGIEIASSDNINIHSGSELKIQGKKVGIRCKNDLLLATKQASVSMVPGLVELKAEGSVSGL